MFCESSISSRTTGLIEVEENGKDDNMIKVGLIRSKEREK
jgi:hypothetical protein